MASRGPVDLYGMTVRERESHLPKEAKQRGVDMRSKEGHAIKQRVANNKANYRARKARNGGSAEGIG